MDSKKIRVNSGIVIEVNDNGDTIIMNADDQEDHANANDNGHDYRKRVCDQLIGFCADIARLHPDADPDHNSRQT